MDSDTNNTHIRTCLKSTSAQSKTLQLRYLCVNEKEAKCASDGGAAESSQLMNVALLMYETQMDMDILMGRNFRTDIHTRQH